MRRAGFAIVGIFLLKEELNGSIFLLTAVGKSQNTPSTTAALRQLSELLAV